MNNNALHEAATFTGYTLYIGSDKINMLAHLGTPRADDGHQWKPGTLHGLNVGLIMGKIMLCPLAADYINSGEKDSLEWLTDAIDGNADWNGISAQTMHPVFQVVVSDLKGTWNAIQTISGVLEQHGYIAGKDLQPLARLAGLANTAAPRAPNAPRAPQQRQDKQAVKAPWFRAAIDRYFSLKNFISWLRL